MAFLYLIPAVASAISLALLWTELSHPWFAGACLAVGILLQFFLGQPFEYVWLAGLLLNAALGVALAIRLKVA